MPASDKHIQMQDICIRWNKPSDKEIKTVAGSWYNKELVAHRQNVAKYMKWIEENIPAMSYYVVPRDTDKVFFLNPDDLVAFTLVFGKVYTQEEGTTMTTIERMIAQEALLERLMQK